MPYHDDASFIITALHDGPDLDKMGASMISLLQLSDEFRLAREWPQALGCCDQLDALVQDSGMQNISEIDTTYAGGMAKMSRGAVHLSQSFLGDAQTCFAEGQRRFHDASTGYSEAVALLALAMVHQAQRQWTRALSALQRSLTILRHLDDPLKERVRDRLADVQASLKRELEWGRAGPPASGPPGPPPPPPPPPGAPTPVPITLYPSGTSPAPARQRQGKIIPIVERIAAGEPYLAEENIQDHIVVDAEISDLVDFALRVDGDSMIEAAILDGDLVLMQQTDETPANGQIVAVIIEQMQVEATLKRFYKESDHFRFEPANESYPLLLVVDDPMLESVIRERYARSHPKRLLEIYSGATIEIAGWARGLIREEIT